MHSTLINVGFRLSLKSVQSISSGKPEGLKQAKIITVASGQSTSGLVVDAIDVSMLAGLQRFAILVIVQHRMSQYMG